MLEIYIDGSCRGNGTDKAIGGIGIVSYKDGVKYGALQLRLLESVTNNEAEYTSLIYAFGLIRGLQDRVIIKSDSQLIVNQVNGKWRVKQDHLKGLCKACREGMKNFSNITLEWIPRAENAEADKLAQEITAI